MKTYLISYDLHNPGRDYTPLHDAIKALADGWWHHLESVWLINTSKNAGAIRDTLKQKLDANDELFVISLGGNWATYNIPDAGNKWLHENLKPENAST